MPQHSKGIRLWLRPARGNERATFVIRDGAKQVRTGCAQSELIKAQRILADYIARQYRPDRSSRAPSQVRITDVLNIYAQDVAATHARPYETAHRLAALAEYWGDRPLSSVNGKTCRDYVAHAGSPAAARRHLEDFRAAIIHHRREGFCSEVIEVVLPEKSPPRERWLTRSEAARLLWACWRGGQGRRKHVARFILVALFTGTRASAICGAAMEPTPDRGHVDLDQGVFYRRAPGSRQTNKRQPPVRLPPRLLAHMQRWKRVGASRTAVVEYEGLPVLRVSKAFSRAAKEAGLNGVSPHTLRHTSITWAAQAGVPFFEISTYFGASTRIVENVYAHHAPDAGSAVHRALERKPAAQAPHSLTVNGS
jgi:integrase